MSVSLTQGKQPYCMFRNTLLTCSGLALFLSPSLAFSDTKARPHKAHKQPDAKTENITVTSYNPIAHAHHAAISSTIVTMAALQARGITSLASLAQSTPGVSLKSEGPSQTEISMRGMSSSGGNTQTVGFYLSGVPLGGPAGAQNGHVVIDPDLYDLSYIDMSRGPQGTTYGSGAMAGTVQLVPNIPDLKKTYGSAQSILSGTEGGGFNHNNNVMGNLVLIPHKLALRVVGSENETSGWINRIVAGDYPLVQNSGALRGDVANAPVLKRYSGVNTSQTYASRFALTYTPTDRLTITPSFFYEASRQNGIGAYDSVPGTLAHYQPFNIAEPLTDQVSLYTLNMAYRFDNFTVEAITGRWSRRSTQTQDASENFNNPQTGATYASNNGLPNPGYYGASGSGPVSGHEVDPSRQFSQEIRLHSTSSGRLNWVAGAFFSDFYSLWTFDGRTPNAGTFMDIGTFEPATTPSWFNAYSPTHSKQYAVYGTVTYALTSHLKAEIGLRLSRTDYNFSSCISGWGSGLGAATPSCTGQIALHTNMATPKFNLAYRFNPDLTVYTTISNGQRPKGGNSIYPTTGPYWSSVFSPYRFTGGTWPRSYKSDSLWSYELGEKGRFFHQRLTLDADLYYENWQNPQITAYPGDWALNINGNHAHIWGGEIAGQMPLYAGLSLQASASYTHARLDGGSHWLIQPSNHLPEIAPANASVILSYNHALNDTYKITANIENSYTGARYSLAFPFNASTNGAYIKMHSYDLTNIRIGLRSSHGWNASLFVNNVFNKHAQLESLFQEALPSASFNRIMTNQPLTGGIDLSAHF
nr:TonB-dependent receptor [uncultured Neokomagataea sp.]